MRKERYRNTMSGDVLRSWAEDAQTEIDRLTRELAEWKADQSYSIACETIRTLKAELAEAKARALPDGWVAVPVEPTGWMELAALKESRKHRPGLLPACRELWASQILWGAMLSARPELPKESGNGR